MAFWHKGKPLESVTLFGFGKSNTAVFEYLRKNYPDLKITLRLQKDEKDLPADVEVFSGDGLFKNFFEDAVFVSPSIRRDKEEFRGKLLSSDAELFFEKNTSEVFAVTGSDGKSTTVTLTQLLLGTRCENAYAVGNIGVPFVKALDYPKGSLISAELSSFQLMDFAPKSRRALISNISPNHLDWHKSLEEYISAKENILKNCEEPILFLENELSFELLKKYKPYALASATLSENEIKAFKAQFYIYIKDGAVFANGEKLFEICELLRNEKHNLKNFLSALALSYGFFDKSALSSIARSFSGLPHRFEFVLEASGVKFFNSSIDSSPQRTLATLTSYSGRYVLIMGGRTKMKNFEILCDIIDKNAHALVLTGENRHEIYRALKPLSTPIFLEENFCSAINLGFSLAKGEYPLILSPASTSYDAFENFEKRGEVFSEAARSIYKKELKRKV